MQLHKVAAMMVAAWILAGCGFTPKRPPLPVDGQRIPVNLAAPYPRPFPPITSTVASTPVLPAPPPVQQPTAAAPETVAVSRQATKPSTPPPEPLSAEELRPAVAVWPVFLKFEPALTFGDTARQFAAAAIKFSWPSVQREPDQYLEHKTYPQVEAATAFEVDIAGIKEVDAMVAPEVGDVARALTTGSDDATDTAVSPAVEAEPGLVQHWDVAPGTKVSEALFQWGEREGWTVEWPSTVDFVLDVPFSIAAPDFLSAANHIFNSFWDAGCEFHPKAYSNNVLLVKTPKVCKS